MCALGQTSASAMKATLEILVKNRAKKTACPIGPTFKILAVEGTFDLKCAINISNFILKNGEFFQRRMCHEARRADLHMRL